MVLGPYLIIYFSLGKGDIAIDDVVFDKYCVYYDGPYGPNTTTTQKTTPSKQTAMKQNQQRHLFLHLPHLMIVTALL